MIRNLITYLFFYMTGTSFCLASLRIPCSPWVLRLCKMDYPFVRGLWSKSLGRRFGVTKGMAILDVSSGMESPLHRRFGGVIAVDLQACDLPPCESFDCAVMAATLGDIPDREQALRAVYGALKPGGSLIVMETALDPHYHGKELVTELAMEAGFALSHTKHHFFTYSICLVKEGELMAIAG